MALQVPSRPMWYSKLQQQSPYSEQPPATIGHLLAEKDQDDTETFAPTRPVRWMRKLHIGKRSDGSAKAWCGMLATGFSAFLIGCFTIWMTSVPRATKLHNEVLTVDGKSFPSGHLSFSQRFKALPCGTTPQEAIARGCQFDIISTAWLPPRCIDQELVAEFNNVSDWRYYQDPWGNETYPADPYTLGQQSKTIFTTNGWHTVHCLFMWKKLNRALVHGFATDGETITQGHTDHCSKTILANYPFDAIQGTIEIIYPPCSE